MAWVATAAAVVSVGTSIISGKKQSKALKQQAAAQEEQGKASQEASYIAASQMEEAAKQQEAIGQHNMIEELRQSELQQSRALAVAGASGGGTSDPDVMRIISDLAREGRRAGEMQKYNGDEAARAMRVGAKVARWEGDQARKGANVMAQATREQVGAVRLNTVLNIANTALSYNWKNVKTPPPSTAPVSQPPEADIF